MKLKISEIRVKDRAREDYGDLTILAESIKKHGQLHPITVDSDNNLVSGGRRLAACALNDMIEVEVKYLENLSPLEKKEVELEENVIRKDLEWSEVVLLKEQINNIKKQLAEERGEKWTQEDTAEFLGESVTQTKRDLALAKTLQKNPELKEVKVKKAAATKARRIQNQERRNLELQVREQLGHDNTGEEIEPGVTLYHGDCRVELKKLKDDSVDLILADPPFGIDFPQKLRNQGYIDTYGDFADTRTEVGLLMDDVVQELYRVLRPGGHMYLFFGIQHMDRFLQSLDRATTYEGKGASAVRKGWKWQPTPLFWIKPSGENMRPYHRFTVNYEAFFFCWKPSLQNQYNELNDPQNCTFHFNLASGDKEHPAQKPPSLYERLIELSSGPGDTILDPFMGSGISLRTARKMERKVIGVEYLDKWYELAKYNILVKPLNEDKEGESNEQKASTCPREDS